MPGWTVADIPLLLALPFLLAASALFSGSETAIFGLRAHQIAELRRHQSAAARSALNLLNQPRMLLITLLLGNMLVNVLYFVISSILLLHVDTDEAGYLLPTISGLLSLIIIVLFAEVTPKLIAARHALRWILMISIPLLVLHDFFLPIRVSISSAVVAPLIRLFNPSTIDKHRQVDFPDLTDFLQVAHVNGGISRDEEQLLNDIIALSRLKARDAMTPRVRMGAVPASSISSPDLIHTLTRSRRRFIPVYEQSLDHITAVIDLLRLNQSTSHHIDLLLDQPQFIPEIATLDQVLEHFRKTSAPYAIAVDEYGQTAGIICYDDVIDAALGHPLESTDSHIPSIILIGLGQWRVDPAMNVYLFAEAFDILLDEQPVSTIGGLVVELLAKTPEINDEITLDQWRITVNEVDGSRIQSLTVQRKEQP